MMPKDYEGWTNLRIIMVISYNSPFNHRRESIQADVWLRLTRPHWDILNLMKENKEDLRRVADLIDEIWDITHIKEFVAK